MNLRTRFTEFFKKREKNNVAQNPVKYNKKITMRNRNVANIIGSLSKNHGDVVDIIDIFRQNNAINDSIYHHVIEDLFADRKLSEIDNILNKYNALPEVVALFHRTRMDLYNGRRVNYRAEIKEMIRHSESDHFLASGVRDNLVRIFVLNDEISHLESITDNLSYKEIRKLPIMTIQGVVNFLMHKNMHETARNIIVEIIGEKASNEFIFYEYARKLNAGNYPKVESWSELYSRFLEKFEWLDAGDEKIVRDHIALPSRHLDVPSELDFTQIRFDGRRSSELIELIRGKVTSRHPFSMVRLGDGESYAYDPIVIPGTTLVQHEDDARLRERVWWSANITKTQRDVISMLVRTAVTNADLIGIPSPYRVFRDINRSGKPFGSATSQRGLITVLSHIGGDIPVAGKIITEERVNQLIFGKLELEYLSGAADKVVFVGCWTKNQFSLDTETPVHHIVVSPHSRVASETGASDPIYLAYEAVSHQIEQLVKPGTLVIVSAGLIGKIFLEAARRSGGVAIDVGAMSDYLVGFKTRHISDMV